MDNNQLNIEALEMLITRTANKRDMILLFKENIEILQDHTFIFFDNDVSNNTGNIIPDFMNNIEDGICVTTLSNDNGCFVLNKEIVLETMERGIANFPYVFTYRLDIQMMNYLLDYYEGKSTIPKHFISILERCSDEGIGIDCTPYLLENGAKINDVKIELGVLKSYLPFVRFCNSGLKNFSISYPFSEQEYLQTKEAIDLMKNDINAKNELTLSQQFIYSILLKAIIIHFGSKSQIKKKISELLRFVNEKIGLYFEREIVICYWFLKDRNDSRICRFFKDIQIGAKKDIFNTIRGMAWDLFHLRYLMTSMHVGGDIQDSSHSCGNIIYIDSLVTEDRGLTNIIKAYPIKCIIFKTGDIMPKVVWKSSVIEIIEEVDVFNDFCSHVESRKEVYKNVDIDILIQELEETLKSIINK
jgi:hypothetical protein